MIASFDEITKSTTGKFPMHFCDGNCVVNDSSSLVFITFCDQVKGMLAFQEGPEFWTWARSGLVPDLFSLG